MLLPCWNTLRRPICPNQNAWPITHQASWGITSLTLISLRVIKPFPSTSQVRKNSLVLSSRAMGPQSDVLLSEPGGARPFALPSFSSMSGLLYSRKCQSSRSSSWVGVLSTGPLANLHSDIQALPHWCRGHHCGALVVAMAIGTKWNKASDEDDGDLVWVSWRDASQLCGNGRDLTLHKWWMQQRHTCYNLNGASAIPPRLVCFFFF